MSTPKKSEILVPALILTTICLIAAVAMAATYEITKPIIAERERTEQEEARKKVLPLAQDFTQLELVNPSPLVKSLWKGGSAGYVVTISPVGYGGPISLTVGIDTQGSVTGLHFGTNTETPGLGTKMKDPAFAKQFIGYKKRPPELRVTKNGAKALGEIDALSGATITSRAVTLGVQTALQLVLQIQGESNGK